MMKCYCEANATFGYGECGACILKKEGLNYCGGCKAQLDIDLDGTEEDGALCKKCE